VIRKKYNKNRSEQVYVKANHQIRFPRVRVLGEYGDSLGEMSSNEALEKALEQGNDLVLVTEKAEPPVVKIIELSKYKYQLKKKTADTRKKSKTQELKELRFSPFMGEADWQVRNRKVREFLEKGNKVKLTLMFKGRQIVRKDLGYDVFEKIFTSNADVGKVSMPVKLIGKKLQAQLDPIGKKK
jgi:translation initiation factor IF-3